MSRVEQTFLRLAAIDSPALHEGLHAETVRTELEALGWSVEDDGTGPSVGNLIARWRGSGSDLPPLFFCSHLDVVEPCRGVQPRVRDGVIESDGTTVLGADAKAGVAALLETARVVHDRGVERPLEFVFTWGEEVGHRGAKALDRSLLRAPYGFVLRCAAAGRRDHRRRTGYDAFTIRIHGRAAHAGVEPERGISAISVAARAIDRLPWGRLDEITTANIGTIAGGSARNAVPEHVELVGEVRSLDADRLATRGKAVRAGFESAAAEFGAQVQIDLEHVYRGYQLDEHAPSVDHARRAFATLGESRVHRDHGWRV